MSRTKRTSALAASVKPLVQHGSVKHVPSYLQADLAVVCRRDTLEREEGNSNDKFAVSLLKHATVLGHAPQSFRGCLALSQAQRDHHL